MISNNDTADWEIKLIIDHSTNKGWGLKIVSNHKVSGYKKKTIFEIIEVRKLKLENWFYS